MSAVNGPLLSLSAYAALTLLWAIDPAYGAFHLWLLLLIAAFAAQHYNLSDISLGIGLGLIIQLPLAIWQLAGHDIVIESIPPAGLFFVKNYFAEAAALAAVLNRRHVVICAGLYLIVALSGCREAQGALIAVAVWLLCGERWTRFLVCSVIVAVLFLSFAPLDSIHSRDLGFRLDFWRDTLTHATFLGHGLGSFWALWPSWTETFAAGRPEYPHNELVGLISDLGLPGGVAAIVFLSFCWLSRPARPALLCIGCEAMFGFPLQLPVTLVLSSLVFGWAYSDAMHSLGFGRDNLYVRADGKQRAGYAS